MATVPNDPSTVAPVDVIPKYLRPTPADFLQAAAIVDQRQRMAGDVLSFSYRRKIGPGEEKFEQVPFTSTESKGGYTPAENVGSVAKGVMQGKVKVLKPEGD
jgi:hypothetical protein